MSQFDGIAGLPYSPFAIALGAGFGFVALIQIIIRVVSPRRLSFRAGESEDAVRAQVVDWSNGAGYVMADGELWRASSKSHLAPGDEVRIKSVKGLTLQVARRRL